jgi:hypothetical protein
MALFWTWLARWRARARARAEADDRDALGLPPALLAQIDATVAHLEATFTERAVAQIQAELRAAAAEERLAAYIDTWLQRSVEELSRDLLRAREEEDSA